jgi:hypothetical protein
MLIPMKAIETETIPAPPNLISALLSGFDSITTHLSLILFPCALDLLLWFGPHLGVMSLVNTFMSWFSTVSSESGQNTSQLIQAIKEISGEYKAFNVISALRSYPVGIPSIMATRLPANTPFGAPVINLDISSIYGLLGLWFLLTFLGLVVGTLYFIEVANASTSQRGSIASIIREWFRAILNVLMLTIILAALLVGVTVPAGCIISALAIGGTTLISIGYLLYGAALIWLLFPLVLSPHGIFVNRDNFLVSLKNSVRITRMTLPTTGLLILSIIVISQGLNLLWSAPDDSSWLTLIGVIGHAFVTTGLLAASFIYYRDADRWVKAVLKYWSDNQPKAKLRI